MQKLMKLLVPSHLKSFSWFSILLSLGEGYLIAVHLAKAMVQAWQKAFMQAMWGTLTNWFEVS
jgi:hypothetical protein